MNHLQAAKELLKRINMSISERDGEYRVARIGQYIRDTEADAYYTTDIIDAVCTAFAMYYGRNA